MLEDNFPHNLVAGYSVTFKDFFGSVKTVLWKEVVDVQEMEEEGERPVGDNGESEEGALVWDAREEWGEGGEEGGSGVG